jgi:hypothetical protein
MSDIRVNRALHESAGKRILRKYGSPKGFQDAAVQAEVLLERWATWKSALNCQPYTDPGKSERGDQVVLCTGRIM